MKKASEIWPKHPVWIVVWAEGEIQGYGVVSKRVPACGFCAVQVPCPNSQNCLLGAGLRWRPQSVKRLQPVKDPQLSESESWGSLTGCAKNSTRRGAVFGLPKSLSLRASPQTGAAIRFQNVQFLRLFAGLQLKDCGFPRRFAPRSKCPWGTDWRGNPSHLRAGCHTRL